LLADVVVIILHPTTTHSPPHFFPFRLKSF
jgi:hypothetical protein